VPLPPAPFDGDKIASLLAAMCPKMHSSDIAWLLHVRGAPNALTDYVLYEYHTKLVPVDQQNPPLLNFQAGRPVPSSAPKLSSSSALAALLTSSPQPAPTNHRRVPSGSGSSSSSSSGAAPARASPFSPAPAAAAAAPAVDPNAAYAAPTAGASGGAGPRAVVAPDSPSAMDKLKSFFKF
jgi:hypothetical protein